MTFTRQARTYKTTALLLSALLLILAGCGKEGVQPDCQPYPKAVDSWVYPVVPGTPEWEAIPTVEERLEACQIPQERLGAMSTEALIESWLDFPFNYDIFTHNNYHYIIGFYFEHFNGLRTLGQRDDAGKKLLQRYKDMLPACVLSKRGVDDQGYYVVSYPIVELLIAQDIILDKLSLEEKKDLVSKAIRVYQGKKQHSEYFSLNNAAFPLTICMRVMTNVGYQPFVNELESTTSEVLTIFYYTGNLYVGDYNAPEIETILNHAQSFMKKSRL